MVFKKKYPDEIRSFHAPEELIPYIKHLGNGHYILEGEHFEAVKISHMQLNANSIKSLTLKDCHFENCKVENRVFYAIGAVNFYNVHFENCRIKEYDIRQPVIMDNFKISSPLKGAKIIFMMSSDEDVSRPRYKDIMEENKKPGLGLDVSEFSGYIEQIDGLPAHRVKVDTERQILVDLDMFIKQYNQNTLSALGLAEVGMANRVLRYSLDGDRKSCWVTSKPKTDSKKDMDIEILSDLVILQQASLART